MCSHQQCTRVPGPCQHLVSSACSLSCPKSSAELTRYGFNLAPSTLVLMLDPVQGSEFPLVAPSLLVLGHPSAMKTGGPVPCEPPSHGLLRVNWDCDHNLGAFALLHEDKPRTVNFSTNVSSEVRRAWGWRGGGQYEHDIRSET